MSGRPSEGKLPKIEGVQRRQTVLKFKREILAHPELSFGFSLFWTWIWIVFQSDLLGRTLRVGGLQLAPWTVPLLSYAIGFFVLGSLFKLKRVVPHGKPYLATVALCMTCGAAAMFALGRVDAPDGTLRALPIACGFLMGFGTACLHVEWGRVLGRMGTHATIIHGIAGTLGAALLYGVLHAAPASVTSAVAVLVPPLCMLTLRRSLGGAARLYRYGIDVKLYVPWKFILTSLIHGLSFGAMWSALLLANRGDAFIAINTLSFAAAALGVFVTAMLFKMDFNHLIYQVAFPLMAASYVVLAALGSSVVVGSTVNSLGCHYMSLLMWTLCAYLIKNRGLSANWVFTWTTGSYILGQALGAVACAAVLVNSGMQPSGLFIPSIVMVFVILLSALYMMSNNNLNAGWGMVKPGEDDARLDAIELACRLVRNEYGLTPREGDVLVLLARGRNKNAISKQLVLSRNTVKTHIRSIYQKTSVHSQQELMSYVEQEVRSFSGEDGNVPTAAF